jgi:hypothetical protein
MLNKSSSAFVVALLFYSASASAQVLVEVPPGGDIQAAINDVCSQGGGTVTLAAGIHYPGKTINVQCSNLRLAGAGMNETILDFTGVHGSGLPCPPSGPSPDGIYPGAVAATPPHSQQEVTGPCTIPENGSLENVVFEGFTAKRDDQFGDPTRLNPVIGVVSLWSNHTLIQNVRSSGFLIAFRADRSDNVTFANDVATAFNTCLQFGEFGGPPLQVKPHTTGGSVHAIDCQNAPNGISISNAVGVDLHHNSLQGNQIAIQAVGGRGHTFHFNTIKNSGVAGFNLAQVSAASVHHNSLCQSPVGLRYAGFSSAASSWGWADPSNENVFHHNDLHGVATPILIVDPNFIGPDNLDFRNTEDDVCP